MKKLFLIGGAMGVGKSTVARRLADQLPNAVLYDGDWAWDLHPFVANATNIAMAHRNIAFALNQFLSNPQIDNVIFTWVLHEQVIIDRILSDLTTQDFDLFNISLIIDKATLQQHFRDDPTRDEKGDSLLKALSYLPKYEALNSVKFDRTNKTPDETVQEILTLIKRSKR